MEMHHKQTTVSMTEDERVNYDDAGCVMGCIESLATWISLPDTGLTTLTRDQVTKFLQNLTISRLPLLDKALSSTFIMWELDSRLMSKQIMVDASVDYHREPKG